MQKTQACNSGCRAARTRPSADMALARGQSSENPVLSASSEDSETKISQACANRRMRSLSNLFAIENDCGAEPCDVDI